MNRAERTGPTDEDEIRNLSLVYADAVDRCDGAALAAAFTADGTLSVPRLPDDFEPTVRRSGTADLARLPEGLRRYDRTFHQVTNQRVRVDGDRATGDVQCVAHHLTTAGPARGSTGGRTGEPTGGTDTVWYIRYADEYVRTGDGWRIALRLLHLQWVEERMVDLVSPVPPERCPSPPPNAGLR